MDFGHQSLKKAQVQKMKIIMVHHTRYQAPSQKRTIYHDIYPYCPIFFSFYMFSNVIGTLKVNKFRNYNKKSSHCPKYERKNLKNSALSIQGRIFQIFRSYFGQCDDFIFSFWNLLTLKKLWRVFQKWSITILIICFYFLRAYFGSKN